MGTIGYNSTTNLGAEQRLTTSPHFIFNAYGTYTPSVTQTLTKAGYWVPGVPDFPAGQLEIGVFRVSDKAKIASAIVSGGNPSVNTAYEANLSGTLTAGVAYCVGWRVVANAAVLRYDTGSTTGDRNSGLTGATALQDPFVTTGEGLTSIWGIYALTADTSSGANISGPTPTGTLTTQTTATIGGTTNQASGTAYFVASITQSNITGITGDQIKAGNSAIDTALSRKGNAAVSGTTFSIAGTGFTAGAVYYAALVQENANGFSNVITWSFTMAAASAPVISSASPSGTIGTPTSATLGASSDQNSGTFYGVVSTIFGHISGIIAAQVKAGQTSSNGAAPFSATPTAISTLSPAASVAGLSPATLYYFAVTQNNANGDSNVLTGSFTTSAETPSGPISFDCNSSGVGSTAYVPDIGSNRAIVAILSHEQVSGSLPITSVVVGGVAFQKIASAVYGQGSSYAYTEAWFCLESQMSSLGSNPSVTVTVTGAGNKFISGTLFTVAGVQQNGSVWSWLSDTKAVGTSLSMSLPAGNAWQVVGGATSTVGGSAFTTNASVTEVSGSDRDFNSAGSRAVAFSGAASGSTITISTGSVSSNTAMSQTLLAVAFQPVSGRSVAVTLRGENRALLINTTRKFSTKLTKNGSTIDADIMATSNSVGSFAMTGLTIAQGAGILVHENPGDQYDTHEYPVVFV